MEWKKQSEDHSRDISLCGLNNYTKAGVDVLSYHCNSVDDECAGGG